MAEALRNALERKLAAYEGAGMDDHAARVKVKLAALTGTTKGVEGGLDDLSVAELREAAKDAGVEGYSTMKKAQLRRAVARVQKEAPSGDDA